VATDQRDGEQELVDAFHRLYYGRQDTTWKQTYWLGTAVQKCPLDLWIYQELLVETKPDLIVETGTYLGGSAHFLATLCELTGRGKVITVDVSPRANRPRHRRLTYLAGSSTDERVLETLRRRARSRNRVMVILDSDHSREHVLEELRAYAPLVTPGNYLVVEDTNVNGHPVLPEFGGGPMEAVQEFLAESDAFEVDHDREKLLLTFNPSGYLRRKH